MVSLSEVTSELFKDLVGGTFVLHAGGDQPVELELVSCSVSSSHPFMAGWRVPFSLLFRAASRDFYVPQSIYALDHPEIGRLELFLVPIGPDAAGMQFQAVFS